MILGAVSVASEPGLRSYQEDKSLAVRVNSDEAGEVGWFLVVLDGHGGTECAEFCQGQLVSVLAQSIEEILGPDSDWSDLSEDELNEIVKNLSESTRTEMRSGSTLSLVYISEENSVAHVAILGDSPVIIGGKNGLWVSPEHNIRTNEADRRIVLSRGARFDGNYVIDPFSGNGLQLTRALGDKDFDRFLIREPETFSCELDDDSFVLVASDGLLDPSHNEDKKKKSLGHVVQMIKNRATAGDLVKDAVQRRTGDNVTAVLWTLFKEELVTARVRPRVPFFLFFVQFKGR